MALIAEDGTARSDAEAYCDVTFADAYFAGRRGSTDWAALNTAAKEQNLRDATDYMLQAYRMRWAGVRVNSTQALDWPRYNVPMLDAPGAGVFPSYYASDAVPQAVKQACAALALKASTGELAPDLGQQIKSETVGSIAVEYQDYSTAAPVYPAIDRMVAPLFAVSGGVRVVRG